MLCSLIWLFTYSGGSGLRTHKRTFWGSKKKKTHTSQCGILSLFLAQLLVQVVVVAAVELVGFHVVFRYNFFPPLFFFFIFFLCRNKYMYLTRAPTKKVVVGAEVPVLPFANSVSKRQPPFRGGWGGGIR